MQFKHSGDIIIPFCSIYLSSNSGYNTKVQCMYIDISQIFDKCSLCGNFAVVLSLEAFTYSTPLILKLVQEHISLFEFCSSFNCYTTVMVTIPNIRSNPDNMERKNFIFSLMLTNDSYNQNIHLTTSSQRIFGLMTSFKYHCDCGLPSILLCRITAVKQEAQKKERQRKIENLVLRL